MTSIMTKKESNLLPLEIPSGHTDRVWRIFEYKVPYAEDVVLDVAGPVNVSHVKREILSVLSAQSILQSHDVGVAKVPLVR